MIQSVRIIRRLHEEGTCNLGVEGQEGGRLRRKGIFREGIAWAKGKRTQEHTQQITGGSSLKHSEQEAMRLKSVAGVTGSCLPHRRL